MAALLGCQMFLDIIYQNGGKYTNVPIKVPNDPKIYHMTQKYTICMTQKYTKLPKNIPNHPKIYHMTQKYTKLPKNIPNYPKIYQMTEIYSKWPWSRYTNLFHSKALQNLPKLGSLV
jgi:hypothetical protein